MASCCDSLFALFKKNQSRIYIEPPQSPNTAPKEILKPNKPADNTRVGTPTLSSMTTDTAPAIPPLEEPAPIVGASTKNVVLTEEAIVYDEEATKRKSFFQSPLNSNSPKAIHHALSPSQHLKNTPRSRSTIAAAATTASSSPVHKGIPTPRIIPVSARNKTRSPRAPE